MAAMHLALGYMHGGAAEAALITTADRFATPEVDRWNAYPQALLADAGTALALSTRKGFAKVVSSVEVAANALERWDRGISNFTSTPMLQVPVATEKRIAQHEGSPEAKAELPIWAECVTRTGNQALAEARVQREDLRYTAFPFMHRGGGRQELHDLVGFTEEQTIWLDYGRHVGHLGAGDALAGLNYLVENGGLVRGDRILLYGSGIGFTYTAMVIEILATP
jgi:3-oxoacyl-[acyl-carrier-protein] synthase-3